MRTRFDARRGGAAGQLQFEPGGELVIPFAADGFGGAGDSMLYADGPVPKLDTVQIDALHGLFLLDAESQLVCYRALFKRAVTFSLGIEESRDFIKRIADEL
ncbi:hypothetical protein [Streptomyces sp. NPDC021212]|uniref:hypothetical protein n=1 Tax=Streptomyces sp. NPDC021212 TaxID=3365118 RepID=UPI00379874BD